MKTKILLLVSIIFLLNLSTGFSQPNTDLVPGVDRWNVKTKVQNIHSTPKNVPLTTLIDLPLLPPEYSSSAYPDSYIPYDLGDNLQEGDLITTSGYLHLAALERASDTHKDGDYHIQLTLSSIWGDSCFIVELPYESFVSNTELKNACIRNRQYVKDNIYQGQDPPTTGKAIDKGIYVKVTGQLFYDAVHATTMSNPDLSKRRYRGKSDRTHTPMHSYTAWELHPIIDIKLINISEGIFDFTPPPSPTPQPSPPPPPPVQPPPIQNNAADTPFNLLVILILGAFLGMIGQGLRLWVGISKANSLPENADKSISDVIELKRILMSFMYAFIIGALTGSLMAMDNIGKVWDKSFMMTVIATAYAGTDFIEGFINKNLKK